MNGDKIQYADDDKASVTRLVRMRIPSLAVGFLLGILLSFITSRFEELLSSDIRIVYFIPFIVYMADAVGTQTQTIYVRDLRSGKAVFKHYLMKETALGIVMGGVFGIVAGIVASYWFASPPLVLAVSLGMFGAVASAPLVALLVSEFLELEHTDPAVGAGPLATIVQDTLSIVVFGLVASAIVL